MNKIIHGTTVKLLNIADDKSMIYVADVAGRK